MQSSRDGTHGGIQLYVQCKKTVTHSATEQQSHNRRPEGLGIGTQVRAGQRYWQIVSGLQLFGVLFLVKLLYGICQVQFKSIQHADPACGCVIVGNSGGSSQAAQQDASTAPVSSLPRMCLGDSNDEHQDFRFFCEFQNCDTFCTACILGVLIKHTHVHFLSYLLEH